jgi:hypothetical protein
VRVAVLILGVAAGCGLAVRAGGTVCETDRSQVASAEDAARAVLLGPAYEPLRATWRLPPQAAAPALVTDAGACARAAAALRDSGGVDVARAVVLFRGTGVYVAQDAEVRELTFILDRQFRVLDTIRVAS